jgi:hypothetical protein
VSIVLAGFFVFEEVSLEYFPCNAFGYEDEYDCKADCNLDAMEDGIAPYFPKGFDDKKDNARHNKNPCGNGNCAEFYEFFEGDARPAA